MNRTLKLSIMLALAMGGGQAWAQNLGPVQLRSTMEQPLVAEIPLSGVSGNLDNIHVALASEEAFSRAGLNRGGLPVALSFAVAKNASGQPVIRVTSSAPVRDTYLDFLVEVSSGGNKVVREVTMLLDPPGTPISAPSSGAPKPTSHPSRTSEVPTRAAGDESRPARTESVAPVKAPARTSAPAPVSADGNIGPIQRGQTLSTIAREHAGGGDLNQMLVALHKANPDAFYRDNINALKTGAVLRVPSPEDVQAQSAANALAEVRRQNEEWRSGSTRKPSVVADGASTGASQDNGKAAKPSNDRLAIVPSKEGGEAASTRAGGKDGKGDAQVAGLKQELTTQQENVASLKQQGAELKSRIGDLEEINTKNQRLLSLKDSEIAELQRKLAEARKAGAQPAAA
ncbi:MAG: FimV/HubP family polar landmark protein, partial [Luteibacter sp.]